jgi:radical SAM protein with 4Fe4S-binding SPASM domain
MTKPPPRNWRDVPELVGFNVTSRCNLRCAYCFEAGATRASLDPTLEEVLQTIHQLEELGVPEILLEGGEIFTLPFADELVAHLAACRIRPHIITNGTLVTDKRAAALAAQAMSVGVSLDGPTEQHNRLRGRGVFGAAVAAIRRLVDAGVETYVNCTMTRDNIDDVPALAKLCDELRVAGLVLQQLHCSGRAQAAFYRDRLVTRRQQEELLERWPELNARFPALRFVESEVFDLINVPRRYEAVCSPELEYWPKRLFRCGAGRRFCMIDANLNVIPCGILGTLPCGNLREARFVDIWRQSEGLKSIRAMAELRADVVSGCAGCVQSAVCDGGCRGDIFNATGDWLGQHPTCPRTDRA